MGPEVEGLSRVSRMICSVLRFSFPTFHVYYTVYKSWYIYTYNPYYQYKLGSIKYQLDSVPRKGIETHVFTLKHLKCTHSTCRCTYMYHTIICKRNPSINCWASIRLRDSVPRRRERWFISATNTLMICIPQPKHSRGISLFFIISIFVFLSFCIFEFLYFVFLHLYIFIFLCFCVFVFLYFCIFVFFCIFCIFFILYFCVSSLRLRLNKSQTDGKTTDWLFPLVTLLG